MKTLKTIQTLAKIGNILTIIVYYCCLIGLFCCPIGIISLISVGNMEVGGQTVYQLIATNSGTSVYEIFAAMTIGIFSCCAELIVARRARLYFKHELQMQTPFTHTGATLLQKVGIFGIVCNLAAAFLTTVAVALFRQADAAISVQTLGVEFGIGVYVALLVVSVIFRYGAECCGDERDGGAV